MKTYCQFCAALDPNTNNPNKAYHDYEYGIAVEDDNMTTILKKRAHFQAAYAQFNIQTVAAFDETDVTRLLNDTGIIRNQLKIRATIFNAQQIQRIQQQYGSFKHWLDIHHPQSKEAWVKLFKQHFKFVGSEIVGEFLMSTNYLAGAHDEDCPRFQAA